MIKETKLRKSFKESNLMSTDFCTSNVSLI